MRSRTACAGCRSFRRRSAWASDLALPLHGACGGGAQAPGGDAEGREQRLRIGGRELGRRGRRRRAQVGDEIRDREVDFVPDAGHERDGAGGDRARDALRR